MSNRKKTSECIFTPTGVVHSLLELLPFEGKKSILDPCAGIGNIVRAIRELGYHDRIVAIEPKSEFQEQLWRTRPDSVIHGNFFDTTKEGVNHAFNIGTFDLIIMNPPYSMVEDFIAKAYDHLNSPGKMAVLLRLGHLAGTRRYTFLQKYQPTSVNILSQRPAMTGGPGDIGGHAWVIWDKPMIINQTQLKWIAPE